jgi:Na+/proline symporter
MRELKNPLAFPSITELMQAILNIVIIISTPIVVLFIIYAGFLYVTAQGNPEKLQVANRALVYGVIGGVIILGSVAILQIVQNTVNAF